MTETKTGEYEMLFVELNTKVSVGVIYRPPTPRMQAFLLKLENTLQRFSVSNKKAILCGDFNINIADSSGTEYLNLIASYGFHSHIVDPTRVTQTSSSTIDHILSNFDTETNRSRSYSRKTSRTTFQSILSLLTLSHCPIDPVHIICHE
ncbi:hypothetical protein HPB48_021199 [Haemaphysalis longicornis]|uniref:Endonuclease/exonuclease/phosphatase domain-containing protein n=1 Tax=Haemaphysalis longicornis TaxID=44386 RepID=A0A9J6GWS5_HAELO|nr:hypothetical protein HPB48_021199 [Haemaphysalis longicornis]